ncbi:DUF5682 family protein [Iodobacter fluviatilis]|uniref:Uncharacterized protein n=1 Tax=Iodobacter fluviatilis TaxID=537 RepID=A0A7G3GFG0_9NEIS|nr:DUF5682 family protein [Iodobacter fluviatilis]QBC45924.1 hypothetical protein C1H71_20510 [Iodobacter fluviatilis]
MSAVEIIGVRHHSPACARLVAERIRRESPAWVLIEGPADFNPRLDELFLGHQLPLAIYSYCNIGSKFSRASWSPLAEHSPEWQALYEGRAAGAQLAFIDLPAWHDAFAEVSNRYADVADAEQEARAEQYEFELSRQLGIEGRDALWEHLFEGDCSSDDLADRLQQYFIHLRGDSAGSTGNQQREAMMSSWIAWAQQFGKVIVVCGGYHAPALARIWPQCTPQLLPSSAPELPQLAEHLAEVLADEQDMEIHSGSYLIPYTYKRLDAFQGYASGMPSPSFQQAIWQHQLAGAGEQLLRDVMQRLRQKKLPASTADVQAVHVRTHALARLRSHSSPLRCDWLDGLAGSLIKDALDAPLPWTYRGPLRRCTEPILVEIMDVLAGDQAGKLAANTPQPPLLKSVYAELAAHDLMPPQALNLSLLTPAERQRSQILHRLRILQIPGFQRTTGPNWAMSGERSEQWSLSQPFEQQSALIEAAIYGASLEAAALAKLSELASGYSKSADLAQLLNTAAMAGLSDFNPALLSRLQNAITQEPQFDALGSTLSLCHALYRHGHELGMAQAPALLQLLHTALDRVLWLAEDHSAVAIADQSDHLVTWQALRHLIRDALALNNAELSQLPHARALAIWQRKAAHLQAAALSRGAALGCLLSVNQYAAQDDDRVLDQAIALLATLTAAHLGDALQGLLALARHELAENPRFIQALDALIGQLDDLDFVLALPAMRAAFSWLPSRERGTLARLVLTQQGVHGVSAGELVARFHIDPVALAKQQLLEQQAMQRLRHWGLCLAPDDKKMQGICS